MKTNPLLTTPEAMKALCSQFADVRELEDKPITVPGLAIFLGFSSSQAMIHAADNDPPDPATDDLALHHLQQAMTTIEDETLTAAMTNSINASIGKHALSAYHKVHEKPDKGELGDKTIEVHWINPPQIEQQAAVNNTIQILNPPAAMENETQKVSFITPPALPEPENLLEGLE